MHKKQLIVAWVVILLFCFFVTPVFAKGKIFIRQKLVSVNRLHLTSGGEFTKLSANFKSPSFSIATNTGEFSKPSENFGKPSFSLSPKTRKKGESSESFFPLNLGEFSKPSVKFNKHSFSLHSNRGEFSKLFFSLSGNTGEFSKPSFSISLKNIISSARHK